MRLGDYCCRAAGLALVCLLLDVTGASAAVGSKRPDADPQATGGGQELPDHCVGEALVPRNHWGSYEHLLRSGYRALTDPRLLANIEGLDLTLPDPCSWPDPASLRRNLPRPTEPIAVRADTHAVWSPSQMEQRRATVGLIGPGPSGEVPEPVYPWYLSRPESYEQMLPKARGAVTQTGGFSPYGAVKPGETVLIVLSWYAERMVYEAIQQAFKERDITAHIVYENDLVGVPKSDIEKMFAVEGWGPGSGELEARIMFTSGLTGTFPNGKASQEWIREQDPELHDAIWPTFNYRDEAVKQAARIDWTNVVPDPQITRALIAYLDEHPEFDRVFWREAGLFLVGATLRHHKNKFVGHNLYNDYLRLMSKAGDFPAAVWRMIETKTIEAIGYADRVEVSDPEGTAVWWEMTEQESQNFAKGAYLQGHLLMIPNMAGGRTPQSMVNYPAFGTDYIPPMFVRPNGIISSTNAHMGTHPLLEVHIKDGYIDKVIGGGLYGEAFRLALNYPGLQELNWPFYKDKGWWRLGETSLATNPKYFKHPLELLRGDNLSERMPAGVIHWAYGAILLEGPDLSGMGTTPPITKAFGMKYNVPIGHGMHQHSVIPTYQARIRDTDQWQTIINNGRLAALDDPEVRALAARYGDPDEVLSQDYVPPYPGINVPGDYMQDYASNPGPYWRKWALGIIEGTNPYLERRPNPNNVASAAR